MQLENGEIATETITVNADTWDTYKDSMYDAASTDPNKRKLSYWFSIDEDGNIKQRVTTKEYMVDPYPSKNDAQYKFVYETSIVNTLGNNGEAIYGYNKYVYEFEDEDGVIILYSRYKYHGGSSQNRFFDAILEQYKPDEDAEDKRVSDTIFNPDYMEGDLLFSESVRVTLSTSNNVYLDYRSGNYVSAGKITCEFDFL